MPYDMSPLGLLPLHQACLDGDLDRVVELAPSYQNIDVPVLPPTNQPSDEPAWPSGETPLMLAALMGHLTVFEYLVRAKADYCAKDADGFPMHLYCGGDLSFAKDKRALYLKHSIGQEHPKARYAREVMLELLDHPGRMRMMISSVGDSGYPDIFLSKEGSKIKLFACIDEFDTGEPILPMKTIGGVKVSSSHNVLKVALSGYKGRGLLSDPRVLDRAYWNSEALQNVSRIIGMRFSSNMHDNGSKAPLPHHLGRVQAGHVEVQLATYYILEVADKNAQKIPGGESWKTKKKLQALRTAELGPERHAVIFINSYPCSSCHKYVQALTDYTRVTFFLKGGAGMGPTVRSKVGRRNAAVDLVMDAFPDPDARSDLSDDEVEYNNGPVIADSQPAVNARPILHDRVLGRDMVGIANETNGHNSRVEVIIDSDSDSDPDSEGTIVLTPSPSPPPSPSAQEERFHTQLSFAPRQETSMQAFQERLQAFRHVPKTPVYPRQRTYEERTRYRNPWSAPILEEPDYLASYSRSQQQQQRNAGINNVYSENTRRHRLSSAAQAPMFSTASRNFIAGMDDLNLDVNANAAGMEQRRFAPYEPPLHVAQQQQQQQQQQRRQPFPGSDVRMERNEPMPSFYSPVGLRHHHRRRRHSRLYGR